MATINLELRNRPDKNGFCPLRVVIQQRGKRVFIPLQLRVLPAHWDKDTQRVRSINQDHERINKALTLRLADLHASAAKENLTGSMSLEKVAGRSVSKNLFQTFAGNCLARWEKTKSPGSIKAYSSMLRQMMKYDSRIAVEDITPDWLSRYEDHNRKECGPGGTLKRMAFISVIIKEAIRKGIIERDPFMIYKKPAKVNPKKVWLTLDELKTIERVARENKSEILSKTAWWFLFACHTGLRYSDLEAFDHKKVIQEGRLILYTQKTGEIVSIKITTKIAELLTRIKKVGSIYSNQKFNQYLKGLAHHSGISKELTSHSARHTFAVNCANLGISQEVAAKLLGHSDLKTTAIYYKIINERVDNEMKKWEI